MGARGLASLCRTLEETAKNAKLEGTEQQLDRIESEVCIVRDALNKATSS
jgi:HPt (histidine-containing phosphotransfer) domain-containing protein